MRTLAALLLGRAPTSYYRALSGITLTVPRGESLGIIGENGAGKSTLLKIIAGVVKQSSGTVCINGRVSALLELGTGFHPEYTGRENIDLAAALMGWSRAEIKARVDDIIAFADIGDHIDQPIKHYSSGMVVRLGFAVATALSPDVLITDEVLAVGDESFQKKCISWMQNFLRNRGTLLLCSHSMYHIKTLCAKSLWIHEGRAHLYGDSFSVTQAYLAYHQEKNRVAEDQPRRSEGGQYPTMHSQWIENAAGERVDSVAMGEHIMFCALFNSPADTSSVALIGIVGVDGMSIFGTHSNDAPFWPNRVGDCLYGFRVEIPSLTLLPGKYRFRAHVLDEGSLRLFDTLEMDFVVTGKSRDYGVCRLDHTWQPAQPLAEST